MLSPKYASEYAYLVYSFVAGAKDYYEGRLTDFSKVGFAAPDPRTVRAARARGYDLSDLRARTVRGDDFSRFDLLLALDRGHRRELQQLVECLE